MIYVALAAAAPPSPTVATWSQSLTVRHSIGCGVHDLVGAVLLWWFRSELQHHGAHRRSQLPPEGVRSTGGLCFGKRPSVHTLLATHTYHGRDIHIVGRSGRRWATLILHSVQRQALHVGVACRFADFNASFETLSPARFRKFRVLRKALSSLRSLVIHTLFRTAGIVE